MEIIHVCIVELIISKGEIKMMKLDGLCEIIKKLESTRGQMNTSEYIGDIKISWLDIKKIL